MAVLAWLLVGTSAHAQLSFAFRTGDPAASDQSMASDSNKCPTEGPLATYVGGVVTNTGLGNETNVTATLTGLTGSFSLTGSQPATLDLGTLAPGASIMAVWHVAYPCTTTPPPTTSPTISIASDTATSSTSQTVVLTSREALSSNAGGEVVSTSLGAGAIIGQILTADITYKFGGYKSGAEFFIQPAGNTGFDAACLRLIGSEVVASNVTAIPVGTTDTLWLTSSVSQSGNGHTVDVRFYFRYLCSGVASTARPYSMQSSGKTNIKYTGNFNDGGTSIQFDFPDAPSGQFTVAKSVDVTPLAFGSGPHTVTYTVSVTNPTSYDTAIDRIVDTLPAGVAFAAIATGSDITAANSGSLPTSGATGAITFEGYSGTGYAILAGETIDLVYTATVQDEIGTFTNSAEAFVGAEGQGEATTDVVVEGAVLDAAKTVAHGSGNVADYFLPGDDVIYTITLTNSGVGIADDGTVVVVDTLPPEVVLFTGDYNGAGTGSASVGFSDSGSNLVCCEGVIVEYSDTLSGAFGYTPVATYDPAIKRVRITPTGKFNVYNTLNDVY